MTEGECPHRGALQPRGCDAALQQADARLPRRQHACPC